MKREIITTQDGSVTIYLPEMQENYHSKFGAIQEANHVFIQNGLALTQSRPISILEIGFGTGLNAFITYVESLKNSQQIDYTGVEAYPVTPEEVVQLNYPEQLGASNKQDIFNTMHSQDWEKRNALSTNFTLEKRKQFFQDIEDVNTYDLIYFDAFGYQFQPDLWSVEIFNKMFSALKKDGILVTYACRTVIKKAMIEAGFRTEKIPGPPGKREMLRGYKY
ncbi:tRNA (5-methylaminomethyl-2-thiouridine)(34)-methyltransferase MnmD [Flavobacterium cerinum]|uniref:Methyltransferase domain-containing protein n=1 Tax=Flavobacterium cerinum TaxID=2502784 RepID=A0A3S3QFH3_9FLAO|nr:tRNA (5-methylaminomethyl-2-thiouridine)(34)-methyltransferase MnmD [Flavobacterium cerinum]RWW92202.1 methyltransferase domain-containing protein [Flavobacterium cerinum]